MFSVQKFGWQGELSDAVTDIGDLVRILGLPTSVAEEAGDAARDYPVFVPRGFVDRMEQGNPIDPLLLQVLPRREEMRSVEGFSPDPLAERTASPTPCALRKYPGRVLLLPTSRCGINCRFCFRRFFPKNAQNPEFEELLGPLQKDSIAEEIILSGGDPLLLDDSTLRRLIHYIAKIPNVKRIRLHSRLPIAIPGRITEGLVDLLSDVLPIYLVLHINHPAELDDKVLEALSRIKTAPLMSQTILLKGINDRFEVLLRLFQRLIDHRILPYYLHQLDRVDGAAHFEVPIETGRMLIARLQDRLPGYGVPKYVREVVGELGKRMIR